MNDRKYQKGGRLYVFRYLIKASRAIKAEGGNPAKWAEWHREFYAKQNQKRPKWLPVKSDKRVLRRILRDERRFPHA